MKIDWFSSVVVALWHPEGFTSDFLSKFNADLPVGNMYSYEFLPPNWLVFILKDNEESLGYIEIIRENLSKFENLSCVKIGEKRGMILMELGKNGKSKTRPLGNAIHEAMQNAFNK